MIASLKYEFNRANGASDKTGVTEMCLAIPGRIAGIRDGYAEIDYGGVFKQASLRLVKNARVGDYALVHAGFVIQLLDQEAGAELEKLIAETRG